MRITHITVVRKLTSGQRKQLRFEHEASLQIKGSNWNTVAFDCSGDKTEFLRPIPKAFRPIFLRNLYAWMVALKLSKNNDFILMRHITFDPFAYIFSFLIHNRISVHHSKEIEELLLVRKGWRGRFASRLEFFSGKFSLKRNVAILGVTHEIAQYENERVGEAKKIETYPNGVNIDKIEVLKDFRKINHINIAFICGAFSSWHGLDKITRMFKGNLGNKIEENCTIHLIGNLDSDQILDINNDKIKNIFKIHGHMSEDKYREILNICDIGLASMALERKNLNEGSTLKVREMLGMGLPVYSGHKDTSLDESFPYFLYDSHITLSSLLQFAHKMKNVRREDVRSHARSFIDKKSKMEQVISFCKEVSSSPKVGQ